MSPTLRSGHTALVGLESGDNTRALAPYLFSLETKSMFKKLVPVVALALLAGPVVAADAPATAPAAEQPAAPPKTHPKNTTKKPPKLPRRRTTSRKRLPSKPHSGVRGCLAPPPKSRG